LRTKDRRKKLYRLPRKEGPVGSHRAATERTKWNFPKRRTRGRAEKWALKREKTTEKRGGGGRFDERTGLDGSRSGEQKEREKNSLLPTGYGPSSKKYEDRGRNPSRATGERGD